MRGEQQTPFRPLLSPICLQQGQQRLLGGGVEAVRHRAVPAAAGRETGKEFPNPGQLRDIEGDLDPAAPGLGQLNEQGQDDRHQTARGHAVLEQPAGELGEVLGKISPCWKPTPAQKEIPAISPFR